MPRSKKATKAITDTEKPKKITSSSRGRKRNPYQNFDKIINENGIAEDNPNRGEFLEKNEITNNSALSNSSNAPPPTSTKITTPRRVINNQRVNWPRVQLSKDAMYLKLIDLDPSKIRYYVHGRVESRTQLSVSSKQKMMSFSLILADESSDIKVTLYGEVAKHWDLILKVGTWYVMNNFRISKNTNTMNYTNHPYQVTLQKFSVVEEKANDRMENMPRHLYIKPERDVFIQVAKDNNLMKAPEKKVFQVYDVQGLVFKVRESEFEYNHKMVSKVEAWVLYEGNVIMISILGDRVEEFKNMFNPGTWEMLRKGVLEFQKDQGPSYMCLFRNLGPNYYRGFSLQLQSRQGEMYLKGNVPKDWIWPQIPRESTNLSQTYLELPGQPDEYVEISDVLFEMDPGHYIVPATLKLDEMDIISYLGVPNDFSRHKVTLQPDGRYFCSATQKFYDTCEEYYRFSVTLEGGSSTIQALMFDRAAQELMGMSASSLSKICNEDIDRYNEIMRSKNGLKVLVLIKSEVEKMMNEENPMSFTVEDIRVVNETPGNFNGDFDEDSKENYDTSN